MNRIPLFFAALAAFLIAACMPFGSSSDDRDTTTLFIVYEILPLRDGNGDSTGVGFTHGGLLVSLREGASVMQRQTGIYAVGTSGDSILLLYHRKGSAAAWAALAPVLDSLQEIGDSAALEEAIALSAEFQDDYLGHKAYSRVPCSFSASGWARLEDDSPTTPVSFSQVTLSDTGLVFRIKAGAAAAANLVGKTFSGTLRAECDDPT
jgi:hypothetical protein